MNIYINDTLLLGTILLCLSLSITNKYLTYLYRHPEIYNLTLDYFNKYFIAHVLFIIPFTSLTILALNIIIYELYLISLESNIYLIGESIKLIIMIDVIMNYF